MEGFIFDAPTQVMFRIEGEEDYKGGIAFGDKIICGCCGGIVEFDDCEIIETLPWCDISNEILGD
jgi:hypothetical protein